ncbi:MAG: hypothetical protein PUD24_03055 [Oscillospiraceae bacterium]|nr:hypothetical protein [Oscillospiraceae bacterium]
MLKIVNKTTKKLRIALVVLFLLILMANSFPFFQGLNSDGKLCYYTAIDMFLEVTSIVENQAQQNALMAVSWSSIVFFIFPIVGFFFAILDKERNLKNVAGIICSIAGVMAIVYIVGPEFLSIGSLIALLLYFATFLVSVFGMLARYLVNNDESEEKK